MKYLAVVLATMVAGCLPSARVIRERDIAKVMQQARAQHANFTAPTALASPPLALGQWALYKRTRGNEVGFEQITVAAQDGCGVWVEWRRIDPGGASNELLCFRDGELIMAVHRRIGDSATPSRAFGEILGPDLPRLSRIARAVIPDGERQDIDVPGGHFAGTIHERVDQVELWSHPGAPFGGVIKAQEGATAVELVELGNDAKRSEITAFGFELGRRQRMPKVFVSIGGSTMLNADRTRGVTMRMGFRAASTLDVLGDSEALGDPNAPTGSFAFQQMLGGLRWYPFGRPTFPWSLLYGGGLYVQGTVGYSGLERDGADDLNGVGGAAAIGVVTGSSNDWKLGLEATEHAAYLGGDYLHAFTVTGMLEVYLDFASGRAW